jgi:phosphoenolpyruvate synthase/pyruvate phosphate dikinase
MTFVEDLGNVGRDGVGMAGGKAVGLGGLIQAGLPVPPGFVLTTDAYSRFVADNHLGERIQELAAVSPEASPQDYEDASDRIRALFTSGIMPDGIAGELTEAYGRLDGGRDAPVAVRSSATAEDLASASFAGQQETYLNVRGAEALTAAVIDCWASLWTARAMAYRAREGVGPEEVRLAVVIQQMVEADAAGVMFTANPTNGRRDQTVISAAWGLGESVVSGTVTTDDVVVDAGTGSVVSRQTADKDVMTVYAENGTREQPVAAARRRAPVLDDRAAAELASHGQRIAEHFGTPQDIEWARAGDEVLHAAVPAHHGAA